MAFDSKNTQISSDDDEEDVLSLADALDGRRAGTDEWLELYLFNTDTGGKRVIDRRIVAGTKRFAVYSRFSTSKQKQTSIARQRNICEYYVNMVGGCIADYFDDQGKSGATAAGRSGLLDLLGRLHEFDAIVIEDFDRFSRELYDAIEIAERLEKEGVELHSAIDERHLSKEDIGQAAIRSERDRIRRRNLTQAGITQLVQSGGIPTGACFGYQNSGRPGFPNINLQQSGVVLKIMRLAAERIPYGRIARILNADGDFSPTKQLNWTSGTVQVVLRRPIYTGRIFYRRKISVKDRRTLKKEMLHNIRQKIESSYNPSFRIVSDDLFRAANRTRVKKGRPKNYKPSDHPKRLFGAASCDCSHVVGQKFLHDSSQGGRLICKHGVDTSSCAARSMRVDLSSIETAIVDALADELRIDQIHEGFACHYEERIAERLNFYAEKTSALESELEIELFMRQRTFDKELMKGWANDLLVENRNKIASRINHLKDMIQNISKRQIELSERSGRSADIVRGFSELRARLPFCVLTEADSDFLNMFRKLVPEVRIERHGRPVGEANIVIKVAWEALLTDDQNAIAETTPIFLERTTILNIEYFYNEAAQLSMQKLAEEGRYNLTDAQWSTVVNYLPEMEFTDGGRATDTITRVIVNALVFSLSTKTPLKKLPIAFGDRNEIYYGIKRFVYAGGAETLRVILEPMYPEFVSQWDVKIIAGLPRAAYLVAEPRVLLRPHLAAADCIGSGRHRIADEHWEMVRCTIHPNIERPKSGKICAIPARELLELIMLKLRVRCSWERMPLGEYNLDDFLYAKKRLVYWGTWDKICQIWQRDAPSVLAGIDLTPMHNMRRQSRRLNRQVDIETEQQPLTSSQRAWNLSGDVRRISVEEWKDLTTHEWSIVADLLTPLQKRRHRKIINGVFFVLSVGVPWPQVPKRYGNGRAAYYMLQCMTAKNDRGTSVLEEIVETLQRKSPQTLTRMGWPALRAKL
ncbi:DNA invertase Pin-like site-specific DNA recombinase/transposase [Methylobacterium sp. OAE515]|uniref:transposase n=1 Tax=Methylobacterium sp. OAE515 TaxID=2817895 RepID=UPI00178AE29C